MTSILIVTWDGGGNVPPLLQTAVEAKRRGNAVRVLGHPTQRATIEAAGLEFEEYRQAKPWAVLQPRAGLRGDLQYAAVFTDRGIGRDAVESLRREPADRVVVDGLLAGALAELSAAGIPYTILVHTLRSVMFGALTGGPLGLVMRLNGLNPRALYAGAEAQLVATEPTLDPGSDSLAPTVHHTGPILPEARETSGEPTVLVSLSTTYVQGQSDVLQRIIDALAPLPVRVVVTTGPAVVAGTLRPAANTEVNAYLPHSDVMTRARLVIGHGGHATTMLALAHGIPLLVIPMNPSFDQPTIGKIVAAQHLGLTLPKKASTEQIRDAATRLLNDQSYRDAARAVGTTIRAREPLDAAVKLVTQMSRP